MTDDEHYIYRENAQRCCTKMYRDRIMQVILIRWLQRRRIDRLLFRLSLKLGLGGLIGLLLHSVSGKLVSVDGLRGVGTTTRGIFEKSM